MMNYKQQEPYYASFEESNQSVNCGLKESTHGRYTQYVSSSSHIYLKDVRCLVVEGQPNPARLSQQQVAALQQVRTVLHCGKLSPGEALQLPGLLYIKYYIISTTCLNYTYL